MKSREKYKKIIDMPRPVSKTRKKMSMTDRAAQFSAFAALTGYSDDIKEKARYTGEKAYISEEAAYIINGRLNVLIERQKERPRVTITLFIKDERKSGGRQEDMTVNVRRVDEVNRLIITDKNLKIPIEDIVSITGDIFK